MGPLSGHVERALDFQQRLFGSTPFGPLYILATVGWVHWAVRAGWDNSGLTIYTFLVSVLAIYFSWVVTNLLNRRSKREADRDVRVAQIVETLPQLFTRLFELEEQHTAHDAKIEQLIELLR